MPAKLLLYDHPVSSYAQKVRIALREKGLDFDKEVPEGMGTGLPNADFYSANPRQEVPALIDDGFKVFDSTAIMMYLEDKYPQRPLLPQSPRDRANARMIEEIVDTHYEAINWSIAEVNSFHRATGDEAKRLTAQAVEQTHQIVAWLSKHLGEKKFFNGDAFGYADICVIPVLNRSMHYGYGPEKGSELQKWHARVMEIPSVKQTVAEMEAGIKIMASRGPSVWEPHSGRRREYRDHRLEWMIKNGGIKIVEQGLSDDNIRFSWPHPSSKLA